MPSYQLISHSLCPYVQRAVIVLLEKNIPHERLDIDLANKPDWFNAMSPLGKVPLLNVDGQTLFESQVIAEYLDEVTQGSLHPQDPLARAQHRAWIEFGSATLNAIGKFYSAKSGDPFEQARIELANRFQRIVPQVQGTYFSGDEFHLVDGVWGTIFRYIDSFDTLGDFGLVPDALANWRQNIRVRPSVAKAAHPDYPELLHAFLCKRDAHLGTLARAS